MDLQTPIKEYDSLYKKYAARLEKLGIAKLEDLLYHIPFRYEDYSIVSKIGDVQAGEVVTIQGRVVEMKNEYTKSRKRLQKAKVADETGVIDVIWFNQPFLINVIKKGDFVSLSGKIDFFINKLVIQSPEYEVTQSATNNYTNYHETIHTGRLVPIYPETYGVSSKWLRRQIYNLIKNSKQKLLDHLPYSIIDKNGLMELKESIEQVHFPKTFEKARQARKRLAFDELLLMQLSAIKRRVNWKKNLLGRQFYIAKFKKNIESFWKQLPFTLTNAQQKAVREIFKDLAGKKPMNRLLEGDVGSGKTVVSAIAMYLAHLNGYQSVLMAPTEILVQQHYNTISDLLSSFGVRVDLATKSRKYKVPSSKYRKSGNEKIHNTNILVGTHAVLSKNISFENLGLVVIDEQQRFGVEQRALIRQKGKSPHLLTMTATPIPRTVALTLYGDLDLSYLDEMPKGRKIIKTWLVSSEKRNGAYKWIEKQIKDSGCQAFIICPFIEESENMTTVRAAVKEYERLAEEIFHHLNLGLLHGKQKTKEKDMVLEQFRNRKIDILVSTPVVEVGIDIPNATIILIEAAERFGLAQLHQLRGRVGRGDKQSYCLLFSETEEEKPLQRLKSMETIHVGAELAELDLKLRGAGDIFGTMQHGTPALRIASFSDFSLIEKTKREAEEIFPKLSEFPLLLDKIRKINLKTISPD